MMSEDLVLPTLLARRAADQPDRGFIHEAGGRTVDYAEFASTALRCASVLRDHAVRPGDRVLVMLPSSPLAYGLWAALGWVRGIEVAVHAGYRGDMLRYVINHSGAEIAVVGTDYLPRWREVIDQCPNLKTLFVVGDFEPFKTRCSIFQFEEPVECAEPARGLDPPMPWDTAAIMYTSGTTGPSKGVVVPWAQLHATSSNNVSVGLSREDRLYSPFPFAHVSAKAPLYTMMLADGSIVFRETFSTSAFWEDVRSYGCTVAMLLFSMARFLANQPENDADRDNPLHTIVMVPSLPDVDKFRKRFDVEVTTLFNMTEISNPLVTPGGVQDPASCGRPRRGVDLRIVDEHDCEVPVGEVGQLILRTDEPWTMNAGYWDMPAETAAAWRNGWFHTGDGFKRNEAGDFYFVDRFKDTIRRRGENISSMELENTIVQHPDVSECAAVGVPSEFGEEEVRVFVVPIEGTSVQPADLHEWLLGKLPKFMVPRFIDISTDLPKTSTSKVRKVALRSLAVADHTFDAAHDTRRSRGPETLQETKR